MKCNDKVRVKSGFYEGMEGTVTRENISMGYPYTVGQTMQTLEVKYPEKKVSYRCLLKNGLDQIESDWIDESDLELQNHIHNLVTVEEVFKDFKQIQILLSKHNLSIEEMKLSSNIALSKDSLEISDNICGIKLTK